VTLPSLIPFRYFMLRRRVQKSAHEHSGKMDDEEGMGLYRPQAMRSGDVRQHPRPKSVISGGVTESKKRGHGFRERLSNRLYSMTLKQSRCFSARSTCFRVKECRPYHAACLSLTTFIPLVPPGTLKCFGISLLKFARSAQDRRSAKQMADEQESEHGSVQTPIASSSLVAVCDGAPIGKLIMAVRHYRQPDDLAA
jgi:hypothetical protein